MSELDLQKIRQHIRVLQEYAQSSKCSFEERERIAKHILGLPSTLEDDNNLGKVKIPKKRKRKTNGYKTRLSQSRNQGTKGNPIHIKEGLEYASLEAKQDPHALGWSDKEIKSLDSFVQTNGLRNLKWKVKQSTDSQLAFHAWNAALTQDLLKGQWVITSVDDRMTVHGNRYWKCHLMNPTVPEDKDAYLLTCVPERLIKRHRWEKGATYTIEHCLADATTRTQKRVTIIKWRGFPRLDMIPCTD